MWKYEYDIDLANVLFFAADVFGFQYCFFDDRVCHFDPEIGEFEDVATSLENWAECITSDFEFRTGYPLAHEWQLSHHPLMPGTRLFPKRPFVVGGEFAIDNLFAGDETERMKFCASLAKQIRDLPDGEQVKFDVR